jgi:hypothetical protein
MSTHQALRVAFLAPVPAGNEVLIATLRMSEESDVRASLVLDVSARALYCDERLCSLGRGPTDTQPVPRVARARTSRERLPARAVSSAMDRLRVSVCALALLAACGGEPASPEPSPAPVATPAPAPPPEPTPTTPPASQAEARAAVIAEAEAFIRAQGYTDVPPTVTGDEIAHEGIEGTLEDRRGMLEPRAVSAAGDDAQWSVVFRYRDPRFAGRGRLLRMVRGRRPAFVHRDLVLDPSEAAPSASPQ